MSLGVVAMSELPTLLESSVHWHNPGVGGEVSRTTTCCAIQKLRTSQLELPSQIPMIGARSFQSSAPPKFERLDGCGSMGVSSACSHSAVGGVVDAAGSNVARRNSPPRKRLRRLSSRRSKTRRDSDFVFDVYKSDPRDYVDWPQGDFANPSFKKSGRRNTGSARSANCEIQSDAPGLHSCPVESTVNCDAEASRTDSSPQSAQRKSEGENRFQGDNVSQHQTKKRRKSPNFSDQSEQQQVVNSEISGTAECLVTNLNPQEPTCDPKPRNFRSPRLSVAQPRLYSTRSSPLRNGLQHLQVAASLATDNPEAAPVTTARPVQVQVGDTQIQAVVCTDGITATPPANTDTALIIAAVDCQPPPTTKSHRRVRTVRLTKVKSATTTSTCHSDVLQAALSAPSVHTGVNNCTLAPSANISTTSAATSKTVCTPRRSADSRDTESSIKAVIIEPTAAHSIPRPTSQGSTEPCASLKAQSASSQSAASAESASSLSASAQSAVSADAAATPLQSTASSSTSTPTTDPSNNYSQDAAADFHDALGNRSAQSASPLTKAAPRPMTRAQRSLAFQKGSPLGIYDFGDYGKKCAPPPPPPPQRRRKHPTSSTCTDTAVDRPVKRQVKKSCTAGANSKREAQFDAALPEIDSEWTTQLKEVVDKRMQLAMLWLYSAIQGRYTALRSPSAATYDSSPAKSPLQEARPRDSDSDRDSNSSLHSDRYQGTTSGGATGGATGATGAAGGGASSASGGAASATTGGGGESSHGMKEEESTSSAKGVCRKRAAAKRKGKRGACAAAAGKRKAAVLDFNSVFRTLAEPGAAVRVFATGRSRLVDIPYSSSSNSSGCEGKYGVERDVNYNRITSSSSSGSSGGGGSTDNSHVNSPNSGGSTVCSGGSADSRSSGVGVENTPHHPNTTAYCHKDSKASVTMLGGCSTCTALQQTCSTFVRTTCSSSSRCSSSGSVDSSSAVDHQDGGDLFAEKEHRAAVNVGPDAIVRYATARGDCVVRRHRAQQLKAQVGLRWSTLSQSRAVGLRPLRGRTPRL